MKILHTSDWHIGHNFFKVDRSDEFREFFNWLIQAIQNENIDILLISGDIFDTYNPSNEALRLYYDFLNEIKDIVKKVIIIGGNHDSVKTLLAPKEILKVLDIVVVSGSSEDYCEILKEDIKSLYSSKIDKSKKNIALGHLTIHGAKFGESEREIGGLESIPSTIFDGYDYVALGHIHKPQIIDKHIVYSGSPLSLNFSENYTKKVVILETDTFEYNFLDIPKFRDFIRLKGSFEEIKNQILEIPSQSFVEIELDEVVSSFDLDELDRDDIYILKKKIPYKEIIKKTTKTNLTSKDLIEEIFGDDEDYEEIKKIIERVKNETN